MPHSAPAGEAWATVTGGQTQLAEGGVQGVCSAPPGVPKLARAKEKARNGNPEGRGVVLQCSTGQLLEGALHAREPIRPTPDEPESKPARAVKRHRSPTELYTAYSPSAAAKRIGVCTARGMRKRVREADSPSKAICFNVPLCEAKMGSRLCSTSSTGPQRHRSSCESIAVRAE
ncbi:hypothetical protein ERJ75_001391600 [Trypanosoma vivax]|nr:hypothetical protein ERJ75_001391600 [Trypanosoma vivax]